MLVNRSWTISCATFWVVVGMILPACGQNPIEKLSPQLQRLTATDPSQPIAAFIYFTDKGENIQAKLVAAKSALAPDVLQRRLINRGVHNVVDRSDVPVEDRYVLSVEGEVIRVRHRLRMLNAVSVDATPVALATLANLSFVKRIQRVTRVGRVPDPEHTPIKGPEAAPPQAMPSVNATALNYGSSLGQNEQISVPAAHTLGYNGAGVVIAVFDSGFNRLTHEAFRQLNVAAAWDFVNNDGDVGDGSDMGRGTHGTQTLSTIGGYSPGNLIGPAYGATYLLAKTENTQSELHVEEDHWCAAAQWAETNGAQIITSSLGYRNFDTGTDYTSDNMDGDTTVITQCADLAASRGIVVINSAGNKGSGFGNNTIGAPSDGDFVLAVGAVTASGTRASFSSVGPSADGRIKPDVMAMGSSVRVASASSDTAYGAASGTSFACPLTAGVAALLLQAVPTLSATQVRDLLRNTANNVTSPNSTLGYGIINAKAAIDAAQGLTLGAVFRHTTRALEATFADASTAAPGTPLSAWLWDFGDGTTSTEPNPVHVYGSSGNYTVTLSVTDSTGSTAHQSDSVVVDAAVVSYCASQGNEQTYEWIKQVSVGSFTNASTASRYSDFTAQPISLTSGQSYPITLSPGFLSSPYMENWTVWVDLNRNGDFSDAGEQLYTARRNAPTTGTLTVPATARAGRTRLRVSMKYNRGATACETFSYGEVEDYTVDISN